MASWKIRLLLLPLLCLASAAQAVWPKFNCSGNYGNLVPATGIPTPIPGTDLGILKLADVIPTERARIRTEIIALADAIYQQGHARTGKDTLFPISGSLYDQIEEADAQTRFSQVVVDESGAVKAFTLAYYNPESHSLRLEKIGVDSLERKQGLMSAMIQASATRAASFGLTSCDLGVVKVNSDAIAAYEKIGFENATPQSYRNDPRFNAYRFVAPIPRLIESTTKP